MKRLIMATMVTAILASSTVWAADNALVAAQQQTQQVQQTQKTAAERISEQGLYAMRDVQVARLALFHGDPEKAKELTNEASALLSDDSTEWTKFAKRVKTNLPMLTNMLSYQNTSVLRLCSSSGDMIKLPMKKWRKGIKRAQWKSFAWPVLA